MYIYTNKNEYVYIWFYIHPLNVFLKRNNRHPGQELLEKHLEHFNRIIEAIQVQFLSQFTKIVFQPYIGLER